VDRFNKAYPILETTNKFIQIVMTNALYIQEDLQIVEARTVSKIQLTKN